MAEKLEDKLQKHLSQPGAFVTEQERTFILRMRDAAACGVGYGWMQQIIEWEWQANGSAAWGPEFFGKEIATLTTRLHALQEALRPFADVAARDIGDDESDDDKFQPMGTHNRAPLLKVGDLRRAAQALSGAPVPAGEWDHRYRMLNEGEIIQEGDECLTDSKKGWKPAAHTVGKAAPDPNYTSHRVYRRLIGAPVPVTGALECKYCGKPNVEPWHDDEGVCQDPGHIAMMGAAAVICEVGALCGWPGPECKSREAAEALLKAGLLAATPSPVPVVTGWKPIETAPTGMPSEDVGCREASEWFIGRPNKEKYGKYQSAPAIIIRRRGWPQQDSWEDPGETYYRSDYFDAWAPLAALAPNEEPEPVSLQWRRDPMPKDGSVVLRRVVSTYRFKLYSPKSQEFKRGKKGRWQERTEYGGWVNCGEPLGEDWVTLEDYQKYLDATKQEASDAS